MHESAQKHLIQAFLGLSVTRLYACKHFLFNLIWLGMRIGTDMTGLQSREAPPPCGRQGVNSQLHKSNRGIH